MPKLFQAGAISFYSGFLKNNGIQLDKSFRTIFEVVLAAHCSGSEGVMKEYYTGKGAMEWYKLLHGENNTSLQNRDYTLKFSSVWEIPTAYFDSGLESLFVEICTFRDRTEVEFRTMFSAEYDRYRKELSKKEGDA